MKILAVLTLAIVLFSCKKETVAPTDKTLAGSWDWSFTDMGWGGITTADSTHYGKLNFIDLHHYQWTMNDTVFKQGTYTLTHEFFSPTNQQEWILRINEVPQESYLVYETDSLLTLSDGMPDGIAYHFSRF